MHTISPHHRAIVEYYHALEQYREQHVTHELALKTVFQTLLGTLAPLAGWTRISEQALANGKRPDGTLRDSFNLPRGYWEAKDTGGGWWTSWRGQWRCRWARRLRRLRWSARRGASVRELCTYNY
jgi:hypothetical protein